MTATIPENHIGLIIDKLDQVKLGLMRLRATLIPEEDPTPELKKAIEEARNEFKEGSSVTLEKLLKELS
jgi:hypothetical protein